MASEAGFSVLSASSNALEYPPSAVLDGKNDTMWMTTGLYPQELIVSIPHKQLVSRITVEAVGAATIEVLSSEKTLPTHFIPLTQLSYGGDSWQAASQSFPAVSARFIKLVITQGHNNFAALKHVTIHLQVVPLADMGVCYCAGYCFLLNTAVYSPYDGTNGCDATVRHTHDNMLQFRRPDPHHRLWMQANKKQIAQTCFDTLYFEMIKYVQNQYDPSAFIASGMTADAASSYCLSNVCAKLEAIGQRVGQRYITNTAKSHQWLLQDSLSRIKLLCRDAWMSLFGKHVDKLQTNHKGMFVIAESALPLVRQLRCDATTANIEYRTYAAFALGLVRGAIAALGINADVIMDINTQKAPFVLQFMITEKEAST